MIAQAILVTAASDKRMYRQVLLDSGYPKLKQDQVKLNKRELNLKQMKLAEQRRTRPPPPLAEVATYKYKLPKLMSDSFLTKAQTVWNSISTGGDVPVVPPTTKISRPAMLYCVAYIIENCQYRPAKLRNVRVSNLSILIAELYVPIVDLTFVSFLFFFFYIYRYLVIY